MTTTVLGVEPCDSGYVRIVSYHDQYGAERAAIHLTSADDASPVHVTYPYGYNGACDWCYLGYSHTADAHAVSVTS